MENNLENKAKFFAQYWGQEVFIEPNYDNSNKLKVIYDVHIDDYVLLKPLSSITDEHAVAIAKSICSYFSLNDNNVVLKDLNDNINIINGNYTLKVGKKVDELNRGFVLIINRVPQQMFVYEAVVFYKKLIQLGYYVGDGCEIEYGWVKLTEQ